MQFSKGTLPDESLRDLHLFLDSSRATRALAKVVELGLANVTTTLYFDAVDQRAVGLEGSLYANTVRNLANGER